MTKFGVILLVLLISLLLGTVVLACPIDPHYLVQFKVITSPRGLCGSPTSDMNISELRQLSACGIPVQQANVTISEIEEEYFYASFLDALFFRFPSRYEIKTLDTPSSITNLDGIVVFPMILRTQKYHIEVKNETQGINISMYLYPYEDDYTIWVK
jgi:hypothetical protein